MPFLPPANSLGADLFWWRESPTLHTAATIYWRAAHDVVRDLELHCVLFDSAGRVRVHWTVPMADRMVCTIDSARLSDWGVESTGVSEGVLAVFSCGTLAPELDDAKYRRLYSMVDWYSAEGGICGLHNDQSIVRGARTIELTEMVVIEREDERHALVFVNGDETQPAGALTVELVNATGATLCAEYREEMSPFTVHHVRLAALFPEILAFAGGQPLAVRGRFHCVGMYLRPYVITEGAMLSAYHGGDRYDWPPLPAIHHQLLGGGEVNPMAVLHRPDEVETTVNLFNTHGDLEEDFWVDATLFDAHGTRVARRDQRRCATRGQVVRGEIRELLPEPDRPFNGHIALSFAPADVAHYPRHLQALLEYASAGRTARVMGWSDEWNSNVKRAQRVLDGALPLRSYYRVRVDDQFTSYVSLTNAGHPDHAEDATVTIRLVASAGATAECRRTIAPFATLFASIEELFPDARLLLGDAATGVVEVESVHDLANLQFVRHLPTATWAAEHHMPTVTRENGRVAIPAGA